MTDLADLLSESPAPGAGSSLDVTTEGGATVAPPSSTVLTVDRWGSRRGRELSADWTAAEVGTYEPEIVTDAHAALFEPSPQFAEHPADASRAAWTRQLMDTPEYRALHVQTLHNTDLAALAAADLCRQWQDYAAAQPESAPDEPAPGSDAESMGRTIARLRSTGEALAAARETVGIARDTAAGLGMGAGGEAIDSAALAANFRRVRNSAFLADVMRLAGRLRLMAAALQRTKTKHGRDDTVGVELGGDVARLIPSELAQLACDIPELELLALDRLARRQSLCRQYRGVERLARGPIVVCVDESGSMAGENIIAAKALALALAWIARHQHRWIAFVGFSGGTEGTRLACPPGATDHAKLLAWLEHFYSGGTTLDVPLQQLPDIYWPEFLAQGMQRGKTDVILITDAIVRCPPEMAAHWREWSEAEQVKTYAIVIGADSAGDLAPLCSRVWCIPELDADAAPVETLLSI